MFIDTHAHLNFNAFKNDADEIIKKSLKNNIFIINVGSQYSTSKRAVEIANRYKKGVYAAVGLHPIQLKERILKHQDDWELEAREIKTGGEKFDYKKYLELAKNEKTVAIGEIGLDYYYFKEGDNIEELKNNQQKIFVEFIKLANKIKKPLIIHCRDAYDDLYQILRNKEVKKNGVIHSFLGSYKIAKKFIDLGYAIGLNGIITYSNSYDRLIKEIDLKNIILETDCPYLSPIPLKYERNEPIHVKIIAKKIAEVKKINVDEVSELTTQNARKLFQLRS